MAAKRATMRDVAAASGVSPATVSFVLNGAADQTISPATRARVEKAAADLAYVPHGIARALREGSSRIVLLDLDPLFRGSSAEGYITGLDDELSRHGFSLLVNHGSGTMASVIESVRPRAVISLSGLYSPGREDTDDGGWVDGLAAHSAVQIRHLAEAGHTSLAVALPEDSHWDRLATARLRFAVSSAHDLGLAPPVELRIPMDVAATAERLSALLAAHPSLTAIACFDDGIALRIMRGLRSLDIAVPQRIAVMGFDASEYGTLAVPPLTTVSIDAESFGRLAARHALGLPDDGIEPSGAQVVARESA